MYPIVFKKVDLSSFVRRRARDTATEKSGTGNPIPRALGKPSTIEALLYLAVSPLGKQRRGIVPVSAVRKQCHNHLALVLRPFRELHCGVQRSA